AVGHVLEGDAVEAMAREQVFGRVEDLLGRLRALLGLGRAFRRHARPLRLGYACAARCRVFWQAPASTALSRMRHAGTSCSRLRAYAAVFGPEAHSVNFP